MIPEKFFESATPKSVNSAKLPPGKIYLKIETTGKKTLNIKQLSKMHQRIKDSRH